ncbi:MAG: hypothetical protein AAGK17_13360 [Pseudomonadota bacterium]
MLLNPMLSRKPGSFPFPSGMELKSADDIARSRTRYRPRRTLSDRVNEALFQLTKGKAAILSHTETPWASITFSGTRHEIVLDFVGSQAVEVGEDFIANLPDHEFTIPAQLVAEASVTEVDHRFGEDEQMVVTAVLLLLEDV